jgi:hypothetical protein
MFLLKNASLKNFPFKERNGSHEKKIDERGDPDLSVSARQLRLLLVSIRGGRVIIAAHSHSTTNVAWSAFQSDLGRHGSQPGIHSWAELRHIGHGDLHRDVPCRVGQHGWRGQVRFYGQ